MLKKAHQMGTTAVVFCTSFTFTVDKQKDDTLHVIFTLLVYQIAKSM